MLKNIDAYEIQTYQQNRYPLLFVDMITDAVPGKYAKGYKNFSYNEWFFPVHFTVRQEFSALLTSAVSRSST